ncbi:DUF3040 domain-containing protein [Streptomyces sp. NPDC002057]|uniref:DUF3040 domain-containing protein n=1 Tax=Streptomyces sp. NPDC002057 TaxID=3154664 RepID=UPI00331DFDFF
MPESDDERLADLEAALWRDDPRFARGLGKGRPRRPREYRRGPAWPVMTLAVAVAAVIAGLTVPNGVLLAVGLILAAPAMNRFHTTRRRRHDL